MNLIKNVTAGLCLCILAMVCSSSRVVPQAELNNSSISVAPPVQPTTQKQQKTRKFRLFGKKHRAKKFKQTQKGNPDFNFLGVMAAVSAGVMLLTIGLGLIPALFAFIYSFSSLLVGGGALLAFVLGLLAVLKAEKKFWGWVGLAIGGLFLLAAITSFIVCAIAPNCTIFVI